MLATLPRSGRNAGWRLLALVAVGILVVALELRPAPANPAVIVGAYASLLASSTNLGPSRSGDAQVTVTLPSANPPEALIGWAKAKGLWVRWRPGDAWAIVEGAAARLATAFACR